METTGHSDNPGKPVCKLAWDLYMDYASQSTLEWRGRKVRIKIRSFSGQDLNGQKVHFDIHYQGKDYHHGMVNTYSNGITENDPFDIKYGRYWLEVRPGADSLEIFEHKKWTWEDYRDQVKSYIAGIGSFRRIVSDAMARSPWMYPHSSSSNSDKPIAFEALQEIIHEMLKNSGYKGHMEHPQDTVSGWVTSGNTQELSMTLADLTGKLAVMLEDSGYTVTREPLPPVIPAGEPKDPERKFRTIAEYQARLSKMLEGYGFTENREPQPDTPRNAESDSPVRGVPAVEYNKLMRQLFKSYGLSEVMDEYEAKCGATDYSQHGKQQVSPAPAGKRVFEVRMYPGLPAVAAKNNVKS